MIFKKSIQLYKKKLFIILIFFHFLGIIYFFLEEISYGQHFFNWETSKFFIDYNNKNETNFHNISNIFNEIPRSIVILWCSSSFILIKYLPFPKLNRNFLLNIIYPSNKLRNISILFLVFFIPDFITDKLNLHPGYSFDHSIKISVVEIFDFFTFNYIKLSEYHELIIAYYILNHSLFFKKYII